MTSGEAAEYLEVKQAYAPLVPEDATIVREPLAVPASYGTSLIHDDRISLA